MVNSTQRGGCLDIAFALVHMTHHINVVPSPFINKGPTTLIITTHLLGELGLHLQIL